MGSSERCCCNDPFHRHCGIDKRNVFPDRTIEQHIFLQHDPDLSSQPCGIDLGKVCPIYQYASALGDIKTLDKLCQGAFAGTRRTDNSDHLAGLDRQTNVMENLRSVDAIPECHAF